MASEINIEQICSVVKHSKLINKNYLWEEEKKHWFRENEPAGFFERRYPANKRVSVEDIERDGYCYAADKKVYYHPHVTVTLSNSQYYEKYFKTVDKMESYVDGLKKNGVKLDPI